jgi:hypothetical protein
LSNSGLTAAQIAAIVWNGVEPNGPVGPIDYGYVQQDKSATSVVVPSSVKRIATNGFVGCSALTSVVLPEGLIAIGDNAFDGCGALVSIVLPTSLEQIGNRAFRETAIVDIQVMEHITFIGEGAFQNCPSLRSGTLRGIENLNVPACGNNIFRQGDVNAISNVALIVFAVFGDARTTSLATKLATTIVWKNPPYVPPAPPGASYTISETDRITATQLRIDGAHDPLYNTIHDISNCVMLQRLYIPASVETIDANAFSNSLTLSQIFIEGSSATSPLAKYFVSTSARQRRASSQTTGLAAWQIAQIVWSNDPKPSGAFAVSDPSVLHLVIAEGYKSVVSLYQCTQLIDVYLPTTFAGFVKNQFMSCSQLIKISSLSELDDGHVATPTTIYAIPDGCFTGCSKLKDFSNVVGYTQIGQAAFQGTPIEHLTLSPAIQSYGS